MDVGVNGSANKRGWQRIKSKNIILIYWISAIPSSETKLVNFSFVLLSKEGEKREIGLLHKVEEKNKGKLMEKSSIFLKFFFVFPKNNQSSKAYHSLLCFLNKLQSYFFFSSEIIEKSFL